VDALTLQNQPTFSSLTELSTLCKHPQYASADARRQTFRRDGISVPCGQNIEVLVDAGFFHVGKSQLSLSLLFAECYINP